MQIKQKIEFLTWIFIFQRCVSFVFTQYADWWEVLDSTGLVHRRILGHSHANEQPFVRSSSPVEISLNQTVWIRAHMNNGGYGGEMFTGNVYQGFNSIPYVELWDASVEFEAPQVTNCAF